MDAKTGEDGVKELRLQVNALRERLHRLEVGVFRSVVAAGAGAIVLGLFLPFLASTEEDEETIAVLPAIFGLGDAGGGPFSEEATMAAIVVGGFVLAILVALVALLRLFAGHVGRGPVRFARVCGIVLLVLCGIGWLLVFALAGHFDGEVSAFSPATLAFTVGGAATLAAVALHPADWRD